MRSISRTINNSRIQKDEEKELERFEIVRNLVRSKLQETGDLDRLRCYVRRRLAASGWKYNMMKELKVVVNEKGACNLTVQNLYDRIADIGRNIDERVEEEALKKIKHCYIDAVSENGCIDVDCVSDVIGKESLGNMRYRNEHRK